MQDWLSRNYDGIGVIMQRVVVRHAGEDSIVTVLF